MMGEVSDKLVLVTRSDREVVVWEYGGGSCLYFLVRKVAYFWALNVTLLRIQLGLRGDGRLMSRVFEVLSSVKFGINRPHSGPDHRHCAAEASEHDWG
jgi:hypothetical protein